MFKLEKVFQNNDLAYIHLIKFIKSFLILLSYYIFSILEKNSVYELLDFQIFTNSRYFYFSLLLSLNFFYYIQYLINLHLIIKIFFLF